MPWRSQRAVAAGPPLVVRSVVVASVEDSSPQLSDAFCGTSYEPRSGAVVDQLPCLLLAPCHTPSLLPHLGLNPGKGQLGQG